MAQDNPFTADLSAMMSAWMKMASNSWEPSHSPWSSPGGKPEKGSKRAGRSQDSLESLLKSWRMVSSTMGKPENIQANLAGIGELPSILMQLARISMEGINRLQEKMLEKAGRAPSSAPFSLEGLDERFFDDWKTLYETEIRKFFQVPQLGLMRFYQEKINSTLDKHQMMQTAMAEFIFVLSRPFEDSLKILQDQLVEQSENNEWPGDGKETYDRWIAILEAEFARLMKSPEYLKVLGRVLSAQASYSRARDEVIQDMASSLPFAGRAEMDELYRELHRLRKRVRELEKSRQGAAAPE